MSIVHIATAYLQIVLIWSMMSISIVAYRHCLPVDCVDAAMIEYRAYRHCLPADCVDAAMMSIVQIGTAYLQMMLMWLWCVSVP